MKTTITKFPGKKILVAEDYFVNQEVTQDMLELMDLNVDLAENGEEALEKLKTGKYDAIFMDIQMPVLDGYGATKKIRELEASSGRVRIPIIALTANALIGDKEKCLEAGMDDYISKPVEAEKLEAILKKYLGS